MTPLYKDLKIRLGPPVWYDRNAVPRYCEFSPEVAGQIYCDWVMLMEVKCQSCGKVFRCAQAFDFWAQQSQLVMQDKPQVENTVANAVNNLLGWGDAPWHDADGDECGFDSQCAGTTMTTDVRGLELWQKVRSEWVPVPLPEGCDKWDEVPQ